MTYEQTGNELLDRIVALGPQILDLTHAWQLFKVPGFKCDDLEPSMAQADAALSIAQQRLRSRAIHQRIRSIPEY